MIFRFGWKRTFTFATSQPSRTIPRSTYGYALVNGKKSVYLPIIKKDDPESSHYDPNAFTQEGHSESHPVPLPGDH